MSGYINEQNCSNELLLLQALKLTQPEGAAIAKCFKSKDFSPFMAGGCHAEGTKYQFLRVEDDKLVLCKKKDHGAVTLQASKTGELFNRHYLLVRYTSDVICGHDVHIELRYCLNREIFV